MKQQDRRIEFMPIKDVQPATRNVKDHDIEALEKSIARFGFADALVLDERTGKLVAGHGRLEVLGAMRDAKKPAPAGVRVSGGQWLVPVQRGWASRDDIEAEAFLVAANRLVEAGGWDEKGLAEVLKTLSDSSALDGIGYSQAEVDALLARPEVVEGATDAFGEWEGMPEFDNPDTCFRKIVMNFASEEDAQSFARLLGQEITEKTRSLWHPAKTPSDVGVLRYADAEAGDGEQPKEE